MTDDKTRAMPAGGTAPEDEPTTVLPTAEDTSASETTVPMFEKPAEHADHSIRQTAKPVTTTTSNGDLIIRPSGPSGATITLGVCIALIGAMAVMWGLKSPMDLWGVDPRLLAVGTIGGLGLVLIVIAFVWAIVRLVQGAKAERRASEAADDAIDTHDDRAPMR